MNFRIKETGEIKDLTVVGEEGIEWTEDLLGNHDALHYIEETEEYELKQEDYDWWKEYIDNYEESEENIIKLARELEIEEVKIRERIGNDFRMACDLDSEHVAIKVILEEIKKEVNVKNFLETARVKIAEEIKENGFIVDSDNTDRFLDNMCLKYAYKMLEDIEICEEREEIDERDIAEELLQEVKDKIMCNYKKIANIDDSGNCEAYYYNTDKEFTSLKEFYKHFDLEDADVERSF